MPIPLPSPTWALTVDKHLTSVAVHGIKQVERFTIYAIPFIRKSFDLIFAPKAVATQLLVLITLHSSLVALRIANQIIKYFWTRFRAIISVRDARILMMKDKIIHASNYTEWLEAAKLLDKLEGLEDWRNDEISPLYDHNAILSRIQELEAMIDQGDVFDLMFRLRAGLSRAQFGILHEGLYSRAHAGTKHLVERYLKTVVGALKFVCESDSSNDNIPTSAKLAFFNETRHSFGRTALVLSGGASLGFYHTGVVQVLLEQNLLPRVISGASAGSIVTAMVGCRTDEELRGMFEMENIRIDFFKPMISHTFSSPQKYWQYSIFPSLRWMTQLFLKLLHVNGNFLKMDVHHFSNVMRHNIGDYTFQEAFDRTGRIINIIVAPKNLTDPPRLLNYLTAPHVLVWSAAVASSAVPGIFDASYLFVKEPDGHIRSESVANQKFSDGSVEADLPMLQLAEFFNVNHFIVSQVNPHATILSNLNLSTSVWSSPFLRLLSTVIGFIRSQVRNWILGLVDILLLRPAPSFYNRRGLTQVLTQEYEGRGCDVTIWPWVGHKSFFSVMLKLLQNPTLESSEEMRQVSVRNTFPKVEMIRAHCMVEMALEKCVQALRKRLATEEYGREHLITQSLGLEKTRRSGSFYTSPSLVNLSGFSVADPTLFGSTRAVNDRIDGTTMGRNENKSFDDLSKSQQELEKASTSSTNGLPVFSFDARQNPSLLPKDGQTETITPRAYSTNNLDLSSNPNFQDQNVPELPISVTQQPNMLKSTYMANFYYQRTKSCNEIRQAEREKEF